MAHFKRHAKMRNLLLMLLVIFIHLYSFSQSDTTFKLIPNWEKGEMRKYEIKNYSVVDAEGERKVNGVTTKTIIVQVVDVNDKFFEINWKTEQLIFSDTINIDNPLSGLMNTLDKDISVRYTLNKNGEIVSFLNIEEISQTIKSKVDSVLKAFIENNNIEKSKAEMLNFQFSMMFSSDEQIKTIVLSDILKFHQLYGYSFTTNQATTIPDNIFAPNPNGKPSNNLELECTKIDKKKICYIAGALKCAETDTRLREFIEKDRIIKNTYEFQLPENWLISHKSIVNVGGYASFNNTYEINLIK